MEEGGGGNWRKRNGGGVGAPRERERERGAGRQSVRRHRSTGESEGRMDGPSEDEDREER